MKSGGSGSLLGWLWHNLSGWVAGEWILYRPSRRPNSGAIVVARSLWTACWVYAMALGLRELVEPSTSMQVSIDELRRALAETWAWFGGIFAATYASLYGRFASQWTYVAGVYNQIKAAEVRITERTEPDPRALQSLAEWKAGFVEDADDLHLATKPIFSGAVLAWAEDPLVGAAFAKYAIGGAPRLNAIVGAARVSRSLHESNLVVGSQRQAPEALARALCLTWLTTATWDFLCASALSALAYGMPVARLWQSVATTVLGPAALRMGPKGVAVGLTLHFVVAFAWSALFMLALVRVPVLARIVARPIGAFLIACAYGPMIWLVMSLVVIPLATGNPSPFGYRWWVQVFAHVPFVTLPLVFVARDTLLVGRGYRTERAGRGNKGGA